MKHTQALAALAMLAATGCAVRTEQEGDESDVESSEAALGASSFRCNAVHIQDDFREPLVDTFILRFTKKGVSVRTPQGITSGAKGAPIGPSSSYDRYLVGTVKTPEGPLDASVRVDKQLAVRGWGSVYIDADGVNDPERPAPSKQRYSCGR